MAAIIGVGELTGILSKDSKDRLEYEIKLVCSWFREKVKYFKKVNDDILQTLVRECTVEMITENEVIIWEGEEGECMYILLAGKMDVHRLNEPDKEVELTAKILFPDDIRKEKYLENHSVLGQCLASLYSGHIFGEVALIEKCTRSASIVATEDCQVVIVPRQLYQNTVASVLEEEFLMKQNFIESVPFFQSCSQRHRRQLLMALEVYICDNPTVIVRQGQDVTGLQFIISGEIRIGCSPDSHLIQYEHFVKEHKSLFTDQNLFEAYMQRRIMLNKKGRSDTKLNFIDVSLQNTIIDNNSSKPILGDVELLLGMCTNLFTVTAESRCIILSLHQRHFERILEKRYPDTSVRIMLEAALFKFNNWTKRYFGDSVSGLNQFSCKRSNIKMNNINVGSLLMLPIMCQLLKYRLDSIDRIQQPATLTEMINHQEGPNEKYRYRTPPRGPIVDLFGPGTSFYYIKNQYLLRQKKRTHYLEMMGLEEQKKQNGKIKENSAQKNGQLKILNQRQNLHRKKSLNIDTKDSYKSDNCESDLESRILDFLNDFETNTVAKVEPLMDDKISCETLPKRGNLVILKPHINYSKILSNSSLSLEESVKYLLEYKNKQSS